MTKIAVVHSRNYFDDRSTSLTEEYLPDTVYPSALKSGVSLHAKGENLFLVEFHKVTGVNKFSGNRWFETRVTGIYGFYRNKNGLVVPYHMVAVGAGKKKKSVRPEAPFSTLHYVEKKRNALDGAMIHYFGWKLPVISQFYDLSKEIFGVTTLSDVYPVAEHFKVRNYEEIPANLRPAFRSTSGHEFAMRVFGKKNMRKDLVKATAKARLEMISVAMDFRNLVPVDWIVDFLRQHEYEPPSSSNTFYGYIRPMRSLITRLDPRSYRRLLFSTDVDDVWQISEMVQWERNFENGNRFRDWGEVHDALMPRYESHSFKEQPIELTPLAEKIQKEQYGLKIVPAKHTKQMAMWGSEMHNCIAGYSYQAVAGTGVYAAVYAGDQLLANLEIISNKENELKQLLGKCNTPIAESKRVVIESMLREAGVKIPVAYWGRNAF